MHILATTSASLDDLAEPVDLRQSPADVVALSFTDSDLSGLAAAWQAEAPNLPSMRLASLRELRHPMSVDLWADSVAAHARVILVRILGGYEWWRYGCDRLAALARERGIRLALLPGECRDVDERLIESSTLPRDELDGLLAYFREGGPSNMRALVGRLAQLAGYEAESAGPAPVPRAGFYMPGRGVVELSDVQRACAGGAAVVPILFYRSMLLAADVAPIDALSVTLQEKGIAAVPVFVASLKDKELLSFVETALEALSPALIVTATAFASGAEPGERTIFDRAGIPVLQAIVATTRRDAWADNQRGLAPADLAMHVVLPELDGRIHAGAIAFKAEGAGDDTLGFRGFLNRPEPDRVAQVAERAAKFIRLQRTPRAERKLVVLIPDYPAAAGRTGYAVGLDVPASVLAMLKDLKEEGYSVENIPEHSVDLLKALEQGGAEFSFEDYAGLADGLPDAAKAAMEAAWGKIGTTCESLAAPPSVLPASAGSHLLPPSVLPDISPSRGEISLPSCRPSSCKVEDWRKPRLQPISPLEGEMSGRTEGGVTSCNVEDWRKPPPLPISPLEGEMSGRTEGGADECEPAGIDGFHFPFRAATFGNITVALAPDRGRVADRRADYHDPALPPRHALVAFGLWLQHTLGCHAIIHVGAHGTLEWLPGKTVALSRDCFPEIVTGSLPVIYPFIVSNPGEAAQAKRRIAAVTLGHLPPPLVEAGLDENQHMLERLVDEYVQADGLDKRRRDRLARLIVEKARETGLAAEAGVGRDDAPDTALQRIDAWLCDIKDFAIKDGLHIYGRAAKEENDPLRRESAARERSALIAALDGRHIAAGPSGAPARGRTDVLPTGRNLFTADPRTMPTPTAFELGRAAADEVLRRYLQDHGDWPRSLVIDLWGSASLRTGGEEIAQGLVLMGCRPRWDPATGRITAMEVLPAAAMGRPRVDVTWRISGLFRDMFPAQIALVHAAAKAVTERDEEASENPLACEARALGHVPPRIFGSAPGTYGAGLEDRLASGDWRSREELGRFYLDAASHSYGGAEGEGEAAPGAFAGRIAEAELLIHTGDDPGRDLLEGSADVAFIGGFAAACAALGKSADVIALDTSDPARPRARSLTEAVGRVVRARATNPRFIEGQLRHGPRGAAEFAETVDRLIGFAETTEAIAAPLIEAVHDAYLGDPRVRDFILRENPAAARAIAERFASARRRGLWHSRRNSVDDELAALIAEARQREAA